MGTKRQVLRLFWLALLVVLAFAGLGYRLVDLQVLRHEELESVAKGNTQKEFYIEPRRGDILDVKGQVLATTVLVKTVFADPVGIGTNQACVARAIAPLLGQSEAVVCQLIQPRVHQTPAGERPVRYVVLKRKMPVETWDKIHEVMKKLSFGVDETTLTKKEKAYYAAVRKYSIGAVDEYMRTYPNKRLASHVLGYASGEQSLVEDTVIKPLVGRDGIERVFELKLAGITGWRLTEEDVGNREIVPLREQDVAPRDGFSVVLTLDSFIQHRVELVLADAMEKHNPLSICAVVVRPKTGEILAMATLPDYDPNNPGAVGADSRRNRVVTDVMEPGSTFKIVPVSGALNDGTVKLTEVFNCEHGRFFYGGRTLHDHESYGLLTTEGIITKSSNIGAAKIAIKMGENRFYEYIRSFGFGSPSGIDLPAEVSGRVWPVKEWSKVSIAQLPMGHGLTVTRLQMLYAVCAIANKGVLMRPMIVDHLEDSEHRVVAKYSPQRVRRVISEEAARTMITALKTVPKPDGTAPKAALEHYTAAGKTGTSWKVENGVYVRKYFSSFIGFFPADDPEVCISVVLDEPDKSKGYYGGQVAAPIFKEIATQVANYLNIKPDREGEPSGPTAVAATDNARDSQKAAH